METKITRVLLIEDDERMAKLIRCWLKSTKESMFDLIWAETLSRGLEHLAQDGIDVILLDLGLPDSKDIETLKRVREANNKLPIIVLTAEAFEKVGIYSVKHGAQDYLYKGEVNAKKLIQSLFFAIERKQIERESYDRVLKATQKLIPNEILSKIASTPDSLIESAEQLLVTILFADIRGFTYISEQYPKEIVIKLLNHLLDEMAISVLEEDGYLDKFLGDGLMAVFGAPKSTDNDWLRAVRAAYKMQARTEIFNRHRSQLFPQLEGLDKDIQIGVGIHSGTATVGFIGTSDRCEYTAIGDCVNVASRLCSEAEGGEVLLTRVVADGIGQNGEVDDWRLLQLKGKAVTTEVAALKYLRL